MALFRNPMGDVVMNSVIVFPGQVTSAITVSFLGTSIHLKTDR